MVDPLALWGAVTGSLGTWLAVEFGSRGAVRADPDR
jgi:hypothetical protein